MLAIDRSDLIKCLNTRGKTTVNAEDLAIDNCRKAEIIEDLGAVSPNGYASILPETFVVETVDLGDLAGFVIPSNQGYSVGIPNLKSQEEKKRLDRVESSVDKVAHEKVIRIGDIAAHFEELFEVVKLPVNVSANCDRRVNPLDVGLFDEYFSGL